MRLAQKQQPIYKIIALSVESKAAMQQSLVSSLSISFTTITCMRRGSIVQM